MENRRKAGNTLENYDSEMNSAAQKSQEAKEASKKEESGDFGDGTSGESFSDGEVKPQVVNPVPVIQRIRHMGLLDLVVPASKGISDQKIFTWRSVIRKNTSTGNGDAAENGKR